MEVLILRELRMRFAQVQIMQGLVARGVSGDRGGNGRQEKASGPAKGAAP
jgi:hypothetical protein